MTETLSTADAILDSARRLILVGGYDGFSYADIAAEVAIRKASIHYHFPSKAELVEALVRRYRAEVADGLRQLRDAVPTPRDQLTAYVTYWERCLIDATLPFCVCALLAAQQPALPEPVAQQVQAHFRTLTDWLTEVLADGQSDGSLGFAAPAETEAALFIATVHGAMLSARAMADPALFGAILRPHLRRLAASQ